MFNFFKKTKEKAEVAIVETKEKVGKLAESADKFISDGNNQLKTISIVVLAVGASMIVSNLVNIGTNIYIAKHVKTNTVIVNNYMVKPDTGRYRCKSNGGIL